MGCEYANNKPAFETFVLTVLSNLLGKRNTTVTVTLKIGFGSGGGEGGPIKSSF